MSYLRTHFLILAVSAIAAFPAVSQSVPSHTVPDQIQSSPSKTGVVSSPDTDYETLVRKILGQILYWGKESTDQAVHDTIITAIDEFQTGKFQVAITNQPGTIPLSGAEFEIYSDPAKTPVLKIDQVLLDRFAVEDSLVMSIVVHELKHVVDYFNQPERFREDAKSETERFLYEMDAYYVEALFAAMLQKERKSAISPFEKYLTDSLQNDNLAGFAALTKTTNMNFVYHYYRARRQAKTADECKQLIEQYISDGKSWLQSEPKTPGWNYYIWVISLWTWDHHANTLMTPLLQKLPDNIKEELISQLRQTQKEVSAIYVPKWAAQMQYRQSLLLPLEK